MNLRHLNLREYWHERPSSDTYPPPDNPKNGEIRIELVRIPEEHFSGQLFALPEMYDVWVWHFLADDDAYLAYTSRHPDMKSALVQARTFLNETYPGSAMLKADQQRYLEQIEADVRLLDPLHGEL